MTLFPDAHSQQQKHFKFSFCQSLSKDVQISGRLSGTIQLSWKTPKFQHFVSFWETPIFCPFIISAFMFVRPAVILLRNFFWEFWDILFSPSISFQLDPGLVRSHVFWTETHKTLYSADPDPSNFPASKFFRLRWCLVQQKSLVSKSFDKQKSLFCWITSIWPKKTEIESRTRSKNKMKTRLVLLRLKITRIKCLVEI